MKSTFHAVLAACLAGTVGYGCASSASHEVVKSTGSNDELLSCADIDREIQRVNSIIAGVETDKKDMTGADVIDGVLWFPFNVIAKQANYSSASKAAHARIETLTALKGRKECATEASLDR